MSPANSPQQPLPQQPSMIPSKRKKAKEHPVVASVLKSFRELHGKRRK